MTVELPLDLQEREIYREREIKYHQVNLTIDLRLISLTEFLIPLDVLMSVNSLTFSLFIIIIRTNSQYLTVSHPASFWQGPISS